MLITIAVCTRDRPAQLQRCLATLQPQINPQSELLVVASAPATEDEYHLAQKAGARYVQTVRPGLDVARNTAVRQAKGDVIAFVDDDVLVAEGWLLALQAAFAEGTADCVTGRVLPTSLEAPAQRHFETRFSFDRGPDLDRFSANDSRSWFPIHPYHLGTGCNMAFHRCVFDRIGLFDEALDAGMPTGGGGDLDIFRRLLLGGFTAVYQPNLLVYHEHRAAPAAAHKQFYAYGKTFTALMTKIWFEEPALKWQVPRLCAQQASLLWQHLWQRLANRGAGVPLLLILLEMWGNLMGPWAYLRALRQAKAGQLAELPAVQITTLVSDAAGLPEPLAVPGQKDLLLIFRQQRQVLAASYIAAPGEGVSALRLQRLATAIAPKLAASTASANVETSPPTVAVIICTRDRPQALRACLNSLAAIRPFLSQLIVVDNGSNPAQTAAIAADFDGRLLREPRPGLCRARNRGLAAAKTDLVVYIDDDVVVEVDWLAALTAVYSQNKAVAGVMGLVLPGELETVDQNLFERALGGLGRGFSRRVYHGSAARKSAPQVGVGANMSFRRRALLQVDGFDEALDPGTPAQAGGDIDLFYRLLKANQTLVYEPAAIVWHTHRRAAGQAQQMSAAYGRGTAAAYAKWAVQGDATAVRMLLGLWLRYYPNQLWTAWTRHNYLTLALAWAGWRGSWRGPWAYLKGRLLLRHSAANVGLGSIESQLEGDETFGH